jgi:hypothetical protein
MEFFEDHHSKLENWSKKNGGEAGTPCEFMKGLQKEPRAIREFPRKNRRKTSGLYPVLTKKYPCNSLRQIAEPLKMVVLF